MKADPIRSKKKKREFEQALSKRSLRDCILWRTLFLLAARVSDILNLKVKNVQNEAGRIHDKVRRKEEKTEKYRTMHLPKSFRRALNVYIKKEELQPDDYLFPSPYNGGDSHISRQQVNNIFQDTAKEVGIKGNISSHSGRKTAGYLAWQELANNPKYENSPSFVMIVLQSMFNHDSPKTTLDYIGVTDDIIGEVIGKISEL